MRARHRHISPTSIAAACLYDARYIDQSNNTAVTTWKDKSGNSIDITQGTPASRPTFKASVSGFGGCAVVDFDGSDDSLRSTATSSIGFGSHTIFAVADGGSVSANQERGIFAEDQGDYLGYLTGIWFERSSYTGQQALYYSANYSKGSGTSSLPASGFTAKILILRKEKDVSVGWYINGSLSGTEAKSGSVVTNATTTARPIRVGSTDTNYLGSMAQVWAVKTALSASIRKRFEHAAAYSFKISCN